MAGGDGMERTNGLKREPGDRRQAGGNGNTGPSQVSGDGTTTMLREPARTLAESGALDAWIDVVEEAAMRNDVTRKRLQRVFLGTLASIRQDGGDLWEAWRTLLRDSLADEESRSH